MRRIGFACEAATVGHTGLPSRAAYDLNPWPSQSSGEPMDEATSITGGRIGASSRRASAADLPALFRDGESPRSANDDGQAPADHAAAAQLTEAKNLLAAAYQKLVLYRKELATALGEAAELRARLRAAEEREAQALAALEMARSEAAAQAEVAAFAQQLLANSDEDLLRKRWWQKLLRL